MTKPTVKRATRPPGKRELARENAALRKRVANLAGAIFYQASKLRQFCDCGWMLEPHAGVDGYVVRCQRCGKEQAASDYVASCCDGTAIGGSDV